jgi:TP53 regulating kinase and related kinases
MLIFHGELTAPRLIYKGAEAEIYLENWHGQLSIRKSRVPKQYRIPELDVYIRRTRTMHEATMMQEVRKMGVAVPSILHIDPELWTLRMEYIHGPTMKEEFDVLPMKARLVRFSDLGKSLATMHQGGAVHGDLTISNVLSENGKIFMIDLGMGALSDQLEDRGIDLVLLNRAIKSTHYLFHLQLFKAFLNGYSKIVGERRSREVVQKMREIERRGRYVERA